MSRSMPSAAASISGVVVHADPGAANAVRAALDALPGVTTHAHTPEGKIVATIEARDEGESLAAWQRIGAQSGVLSVAMAYHQIEDEPDMEV